MEILDALEQKVTELLDEVVALRKRNAQLEALAEGATADQGNGEELARLEEDLRQERDLREAVSKRVDTLVRHLEELNSAG